MGNPRRQSVISRVLSEAAQGPELRTHLLAEIGGLCGDRFVASFYTSFDHPDGGIRDQDAEMLSNLLNESPEAEKKGLLLLIDSPGGDPLAAERVIKVCREHSAGNFAVLVPGQAKSAATLIALGAKEIYLAETSELGPIDVQVGWRGSLTPAYAILEAYDELLAKGINLGPKKRIEPILQQLQFFDPSEMHALRQVNNLSVDIAVKALATGMLAGHTRAAITKLVGPFIEPKRHKTHGRPIYLKDILSYDKKGMLKMMPVPLHSPTWNKVSEYHIRVHGHMNATPLVKLVESVDHTYFVTAQPESDNAN